MAKSRTNYKPLYRRMAICCVIATVAVFVVSELAFKFQDDRTDRGPKTVQLIIPPGTSDLVAAGQLPPDIPEEMAFVIGDVLEVVNRDSVDHQLGPIWVPPGGTASLHLGEEEHIALACSFQPTQYLGIRVKEPTNLGTRLIALAVAAPPTAAILLVYSIAASPLKLSADEPPQSPNRDRKARDSRQGDQPASESYSTD